MMSGSGLHPLSSCPRLHRESAPLHSGACSARQIYFRYQRGETRNPAFKNFWLFVNYLGWRCRRMIRAHARANRSSSTS